MKKKYQEVKKSKCRVKVIERAGMDIGKKLQKSYPFVKEKCWGECFVCISEGKGDFLKENVNYEVEYVGEGCDYVYYGETCLNGMFCVGVKSASKASVRKKEKVYLYLLK